MTVAVNPTKRQAETFYKRIAKALGETPATEVVEQGQQWPAGPVLCRDFEGWHGGTTRWAVVWECGDEWPHAITEKLQAAARTAGLFIEPINGYALGIYRY